MLFGSLWRFFQESGLYCFLFLLYSFFLLKLFVSIFFFFFFLRQDFSVICLSVSAYLVLELKTTTSILVLSAGVFDWQLSTVTALV